MWLVTPLLAAAVTAQSDTGSSETSQSSALARVRHALSHPATLTLAPPEPTFRVDISQRVPFQHQSHELDLSDTMVPAGGLYAFEQRRRLGDPWSGQPLIKVDLLPVAEWLLDVATSARQVRAERAARDEVTRALVAFCVANRCQEE